MIRYVRGRESVCLHVCVRESERVRERQREIMQSTLLAVPTLLRQDKKLDQVGKPGSVPDPSHTGAKFSRSIFVFKQNFIFFKELEVAAKR